MALLNRIADEKARLDKEEAELDRKYVAQKTAIAERRRFLLIAEQKVTPEFDQIIEKLGLNI